MRISDGSSEVCPSDLRVMAGLLCDVEHHQPAMTRTEIKPAVSAVKELLAQEPDALREIVRSVMQAMLEAEMDEALGAGKSERSAARLGYRSGHYPRTLVTRVGQLELRAPAARAGRFPTDPLERDA